MNEKLIRTQALYAILDYEPFLILLSLVVFSWLFYKLFLREATYERHRAIQGHFQNLLRHSLWLIFLFTCYKSLSQFPDGTPWLRGLPYFAVATFCWGLIVFVKTCRLVILQYMFLGSMKAGVPILLVNIFSLILSLTLALWSASYVFGLQLAPLLATSAAFSIILGLAMQDTLGNLFAGISLQLDRSFEIGDWIEVVMGIQRVVGQVKEITWRATILEGWSDEVITLPNRTMANSQISNYQSGDKPIMRSQLFRIPLEADLELVKSVLEKSLTQIPEVRQDMANLVYLAETTDSWMGVKAAYYINSFGGQFRIGDEVLAQGLKALTKAGIKPAHQTQEIRLLSGAPQSGGPQ
jgi:small-conductance mechanosensitive channel